MLRDLKDYSQQYLNQPFESQMVYFRRKKILELAGNTANLKILEIGCGMEPAYMWMSEFQSLTIVEPSEVFFRNAEYHKPDDSSVHLVQALAEEISTLPSAPFDLILISSLLHELSNPEHLLLNMRSWCTSQTRMILNVPNALSFHRLLAVEMGLIASAYTPSAANIQFQQHRIFDQNSFQELAKSCGFRILSSETAFIKPFTHRQMQDLLDLKILNADLLNGLMQVSPVMPENGAEIFMVICPE